MLSGLIIQDSTIQRPQLYKSLSLTTSSVLVPRLAVSQGLLVDQRLAGKSTKSLVGKKALGSPTGYSIKREVQAIKKLAMQFAAETGSGTLLRMINMALEAEAIL